MKQLFRKLAGRRYYRLFLLAGYLLSAWALYQLAFTAMFVHECVEVPGVVTDVRQKPYEDFLEALVHGSGSAAGDMSYQPLVRFSLPSGMVINRLMTDAGNQDYTIGQTINILTPELDPSGARINEWKYIWGTQTLDLGVGVLMVLAGYLLRGTLIRKISSPKEEKPKPRRKNTAEGQKKPTTSSRRRKNTAATSDSPAPKRRSRKKKAE